MRTSSKIAALVVLLAIAAGTTHAAAAASTSASPSRRLMQLNAGTCRTLFNQVGGLDALTRFLPACAPGASYNAQSCCNQAKSILGLAPQAGQCLCNAEVWNEVRSQATGAGYGSTLSDFLGTCKIKVHGNGC